MMKTTKKLVCALLSLVMLWGLSACAGEGGEPEPDQIILTARLDVPEEIRTVTCDVMLDGEVVMTGGSQRADGKPFGGGTADYSFRKGDLPSDAEGKELSVRMYLSEELVEPFGPDDTAAHFDQSPVEPELRLPAEWGTRRPVVITGDKTTGYTAALTESE